MSEIRVLVVEDEPMIAADIEQSLSNIDFKVSAVVYDYEDAVRQLAANTPDVAIIDINLQDKFDGIDIADIINSKYHIPFIFLTSHADKSTLDRAKKSFPSGYIVKPFNEQDLLAGLEIALYNHAQRNVLHASDITMHTINRHLLKELSEREFDVLRAIYSGKTNRQMAEELFVSVNTIKTHICNIYLKLDVASRTAAIARIRSWT